MHYCIVRGTRAIGYRLGGLVDGDSATTSDDSDTGAASSNGYSMCATSAGGCHDAVFAGDIDLVGVTRGIELVSHEVGTGIMLFTELCLTV